MPPKRAGLPSGGLSSSSRIGDGAPVIPISRWKVGADCRDGRTLAPLPSGSDGRKFGWTFGRPTRRLRAHLRLGLRTAKWMYFQLQRGGLLPHLAAAPFRRELQSRSRRGRLRKKASPWRPTVDPSSLPWANDSDRYPCIRRDGDRQISLEGYAYDPRFTPDFKKLCYRILKGSQPSSDPTELWIADLNSGSTQVLWPGYSVLGGGTPIQHFS
jgi:hypothetical protein